MEFWFNVFVFLIGAAWGWWFFGYATRKKYSFVKGFAIGFAGSITITLILLLLQGLIL